jgi:ankyrin repeat protein
MADPMIVELLLHYGADPNVTENINKATPLHIAAGLNVNVKIFELLLRAGADPNKITSDGATSICFAAFAGASAEIVSILLEFGADPNKRFRNQTAYDICLQRRHRHLISVFETLSPHVLKDNVLTPASPKKKNE